MLSTLRKIVWTEHSKIKMRQYGLSVSRILAILARPERREKAIVPGLIAVMRTNRGKPAKVSLFGGNGAGKKISKWGNAKKTPGEIWIMYKDTRKREDGNIRKIISAWRYPGVTKPGDQIPIPEDIKNDLIRGIIK